MARGSGLGRGRHMASRMCRWPVLKPKACDRDAPQQQQQQQQAAMAVAAHGSSGRICWLPLPPSLSLRTKLVVVVALLLLVSLTCFFRASVTILWVWDSSSHTTWLVQHLGERQSPVAPANVTLSWPAAAPGRPPAGLGCDAPDDAAVLRYASLDPYIDKVDAPIIARLLASVVTPGGAVQIAQAKKTNEEDIDPEAHSSTTSKRLLLKRARLEAWEVEVSRPRYRPYWPRFQHLLREWAAARARAGRYDPQHGTMKNHLLLHLLNATAANRTCAVVGNSGVLLRRDYGGFIDSHDVVIRINGARTLHYERQVGAKTTLALANSNVLRGYARPGGTCAYPYAGRVPLLVYICQPAHLMEVAMCRALRPGTPLLVTDPRLDALCFRMAKWYSLREWAGRTRGCGGFREWDTQHGGILFHHSSGMQAVVLALGLCQRVHLFGFGKPAGVKHHYHGPQKAELSIHDYAAEYALYRDLQHNGSARVAFLNDTFSTQGFLLPPLRLFL